jgi:hypothetical protein
MSKHIESGLYVAVDGSYGDASGMSIIDDRDWVESDYTILEEQGDFRRADLADAIELWIKEGRPAVEGFDPEKGFLGDWLIQKYIGY